MPKNIKKEIESTNEVRENDNVEQEMVPTDSMDGWLETNEVRENGTVKVFERIVNGVREYKEVKI